MATGLRSLPNTGQSFAATQAAWRFYANERISLPVLAEPIIAQAQASSVELVGEYALIMHDFSSLDFTDHESKSDRISLYNKQELGYFLQSALLVSDLSGDPIAPLYLGLEAEDGVHSTRRATVLPRRRQLDELNRTFGYVESLELGQRCVHIVDRQADSLLHLRRFVRSARRFVIRSDDVRRVKFEGRSLLLEEVEEELKKELKKVRRIEYQGKKAIQYVAETRLVLAKVGRTRFGFRAQDQRRYVKGRPIELRYVWSEVRDPDGQLLATWRLWTNVEVEIEAAKIALWYYWRWRIESFFKLLKRGGQQLEQWQQESAQAVAKRLLIVAQVCVIVWALAASTEEKAKELRRFLISLSGRLMKRGVEYTTPALLAGMWQFLAMIDALERFTTAELLEMAQDFLSIIGDKPSFKDL